MIAGWGHDEAIKRGSKDNISCMIVHITKKNTDNLKFQQHSFVPGIPPPIENLYSINLYKKILLISFFLTLFNYNQALSQSDSSSNEAEIDFNLEDDLS